MTKPNLIINNTIKENDYFVFFPDSKETETKKQAGKIVEYKLTGDLSPSEEELLSQELPTLQEKILLPLRLYLLRKEEIRSKYTNFGLWINTHDELKLLNNIEDINAFPVIAVFIEKFADGRIYSQATLLRQKYKYQNDLRAIGEILKDQIFYLKRSGFTSYLIKEGKNVEDALLSLNDFSENYQSRLNEEPLWKRVSRK
jgi:uncharacterized protein (DUF934 family)